MSENIVKQTAKVLGMTYKEIAEEIGVAEGTLTNAASTGKVSHAIEKSLILLHENVNYKEQLNVIKNFKKLMDNC